MFSKKTEILKLQGKTLAHSWVVSVCTPPGGSTYDIVYNLL